MRLSPVDSNGQFWVQSLSAKQLKIVGVSSKLASGTHDFFLNVLPGLDYLAMMWLLLLIRHKKNARGDEN